MKVNDCAYGCRYSVRRGFYKDCVGTMLELSQPPGETPQGKLRIQATAQKQLSSDLVVDVWIDLPDLEPLALSKGA